MYSGFPYIKLKEICDVNQGLQIPIEQRFTENGKNRYFYITVQFLKESHTNKFYVENPPSSSICHEDDILIVRTGSTGQIVTGVNGCFHNNFFKVNYNKKLINGRYLYHCLKTKEKYKEMLQRAGVTTIPDLNHFMFLDMEIPFPEKSVQDQIAEILDSLESKIELNNKINAELEAMAKTIYDYWFVQFDFPNAKGKPYKSCGGKMVWNEELKREIPEGWEASKIGKLLNTSLGGTPSTKVKEYWENGTICWLNSGEIANFPIIDSELKITEAAIRNSATDLLPKGSVMLSITRHLRPSILGIDACANQSVVGIMEKDDIKCYFLYPYLQNEIPRLMSMRSGAQQPHINKEIVDESMILIPNKGSNILKEYNSTVGNLYELIINNALQNQQLASLRDWLLPMLMNGQVKVKDVGDMAKIKTC